MWLSTPDVGKVPGRTCNFNLKNSVPEDRVKSPLIGAAGRTSYSLRRWIAALLVLVLQAGNGTETKEKLVRKKSFVADVNS